MTDPVNEIISDGGVCTTVPATLGLLIMYMGDYLTSKMCGYYHLSKKKKKRIFDNNIYNKNLNTTNIEELSKNLNA